MSAREKGRKKEDALIRLVGWIKLLLFLLMRAIKTNRTLQAQIEQFTTGASPNPKVVPTAHRFRISI